VTMAEPLLVLREVDFSVHHGPIVRGVSLAIAEGEAAALVGPSGGGQKHGAEAGGGAFGAHPGGGVFPG
jgi:ABC-type transporter Mla maintaining outer membrane lipid asymmetry ATPase subunit MlaF